ncbi:IS66 family insertion sequence element accessory protein TnpB [Escherichia coli]
MNARKAVLADNPELILRVLQLRFDESLSYPRISAQTGISKTAIFSLVRRFHQVFTDWPLSGEYSCVQLARALFPGRYPSAPTVTQTVKSLLPVTLTPEPDNKIPAPVQIPEQINTPPDSLCCELVLPAGTLRLKGKLTPALLQTLIREIKGSSH